jgi:Uma2 family endonuclease
VVCGDLAFSDPRRDTVTNPVLLIEVLSDSTRNYDRGEKFQCYRTLPSLMEYVTVARDKIHVEQYTRQPTGQWLLTEYADQSSTIGLRSLAAELHVSDICEKVDFSQSE